MIHHFVDYPVVDSSPYFTDTAIEHLAIEVDVINVYIPVVSSVPGCITNLEPLFGITRDVLVKGDYIAHDAIWHSYTLHSGATARGDAICNALDSEELMRINEDSHTRRPQKGRSSSPDLTFTNPCLGINA